MQNCSGSMRINFAQRFLNRVQPLRSGEHCQCLISNSGAQCIMCFCLSAFHMLETSFMMSTFLTPGFLRLSSWILSRW